jgi:hypothetical protein
MINFTTEEFKGKYVNSSRDWVPQPPFHNLQDCADSYNRDDNHFRSDWIKGLEGIMGIGDCVLGKHNPEEVYQKALKPSKRHSHQACLTTEYVRVAVQKLQAEFDLNKDYSSYEDIYKEVCRILKDVQGIGPTTVYDIALRLAHYHVPSLEPKEYLYLHAGAANGFMALSDPANKWLPKDSSPKMEKLRKTMNKEGRIPMEELKDIIKPLYDLGALHLENFLCGYSKFLNRKKKNS